MKVEVDALLLLVAFFLPPLAVLMLPKECVGNRGMAFVVSLILTLIFIPLAWAYVFPMIRDCHPAQPEAPSPAPATKPAAVPAAVPTTGKVTGQKVIVINVGQQ